MNYHKTRDLPVYPPQLERSAPPLLRPDLSDDDIDLALSAIASKEAGKIQAARTQYGRRIQVDTYLKLERKQPVSFGQFLAAVGASVPRR